jgi:hypothetical protein
MRRLIRVAACASVLALAGCSVDDPHSDTAPAEESGRGAGADAPTPTRAGLPAGGSQSGGARRLLERFALGWTTWSFQRLPQARRELAELAVGRLHASLLAEARRAADDDVLRASNSGNRGTVAGIVLHRTGRALVVTRELASLEDGASQSGYFVYLARVERTAEGWRLSSWRAVS